MGKTKSKKNYGHNKKIMRSVITGRVLNGRDAILADEAEDYLKLKGYQIIEIKSDKLIIKSNNKFI